MCTGIPMQVLSIEPGHALCLGRGEQRRVGTALVAPLLPGDWVLVFLDNVHEAISAERALEVNATLDLLASALNSWEQDNPSALPEAAFELPSRMSREQLLALSGSSL